MKLFAFILGFYLLALNCFPCGDREECNAINALIIAEATSHDEHQHNAEACSPFCNCACCAAAAFHQLVKYTKQPAFSAQLQPFHFSDDILSYDFNSVWQPPKFV